MRFNNLKGQYPLPILRPEEFGSNYVNSDFIFSLEINQKSIPHSLLVDFEIKHDGIDRLVREKNATVSLAIHCESTYLYDVIDLANTSNQSVNIDEQIVFGSVYFTLIVKATKAIIDFRPKYLETGFDGLAFNVRKGDILAISEEHRHYYSLPPLQLGADIFELEEQPELAELCFEVELTDSKIKIGVGSKLNELVQNNMNTMSGRTNNLSSIYFPALVEVLYQMQDESFDVGFAWYEAISTAMKSVGVPVDDKNWEPLLVAQRLLKFPYEPLLARSGK